MPSLLDAFWRAAAYCLHPRVILLSLLPLLIAGGLALGAGALFWEPAVASVRAAMDQWPLVATMMGWLEAMGGAGLRSAIAPIVVVALALPVIVVLSLLLVATLMTPAIVSLVARRRFPHLERKRGGGFVLGLFASLGWTALALLATVLSMPLWLVPPLALVLPPLIWGWLTYRVLAFDVLAEHASAAERRLIVSEQHWPLLAIGVVCGYLGAAPALLWAVSAAALVFAPVLVVVSIWLYTLVFAFSALWFAHYALAALERLRLREQPPGPPSPPPAEAAPAVLLSHTPAP